MHITQTCTHTHIKDTLDIHLQVSWNRGAPKSSIHRWYFFMKSAIHISISLAIHSYPKLPRVCLPQVWRLLMHLTFGAKLRSFAPQEAARELWGVPGFWDGKKLEKRWNRHRCRCLCPDFSWLSMVLGHDFSWCSVFGWFSCVAKPRQIGWILVMQCPMVVFNVYRW